MLTVVALLLAQLTSLVETEAQAFQSILSLEAAYGSALDSGALRLPSPYDLSTKHEFPAEARALIEACERFVSSWPQSARRGDVLFKAAHLHSRYNHFDEAVPVLTGLVYSAPDAVLPRPQSGGDSSLCALAAALVLDAYELRDDHVNLNVSARKFATSQCAARNRRLAKELREHEIRSTFLLARDHKEPMHRADAFVHVAADFPDSDVAEPALLHASTEYRQAGLAETANATCKRFLALYPKSQFAAQVRKALTDATKASPQR